MHSEGSDHGDMLASWKKDVAQYRVAAGTDLQQAVQEATLMEHAPATYRDLLKVVPLANRETYQALRAYVGEWTLAQRTYDDLGRHTTPSTSAPMGIGPVKGTKEKGKKGMNGKGKEKGKGIRDIGEAKERRSLFCRRVWACGKWGHKKAQRRGLKRDQGGKPPAAAAQAAATMNQVQSSPPDEDSFWIFAVGASSGRNARFLVGRGADEHVCPTDFASATLLGPTKGSMLFDAQQHVIEAHGTRTVYMRLGPDG